MKTLILIVAVVCVSLTAGLALSAVPTCVSVSSDVRNYLDHRASQSCRGRIIDVTEYVYDDSSHIDPQPPEQPPLRYWRLRIAIEERYTGRHKKGEMTLMTLVMPPVVQPGALVLAYGTKTKSDRGRLWGNVFPLTALPDGCYVVDERTTNVIDVLIAR